MTDKIKEKEEVLEAVEPTYEFKDLEGEADISPIKRTIAKTMLVTETFNVYDAISYIIKMDKAISDKEAEIEGLKNMKEAYEKELKLIERELGVQKEEEEYQKALAEKQVDEKDEDSRRDSEVAA